LILNNPKLNTGTPGDGIVCDSSDPDERDQFDGSIITGPTIIKGKKSAFEYMFNSFPNDICVAACD